MLSDLPASRPPEARSWGWQLRDDRLRYSDRGYSMLQAVDLAQRVWYGEYSAAGSLGAQKKRHCYARPQNTPALLAACAGVPSTTSTRRQAGGMMGWDAMTASGQKVQRRRVVAVMSGDDKARLVLGCQRREALWGRRLRGREQGGNFGRAVFNNDEEGLIRAVSERPRLG